MRSRWTRPPSRRTSHTVHIQYEVPSLSPPHPPESTTIKRCNGNRRWHEMEVAAIFGPRVLWPQYRRLVVVVAWSWWMEAWSGRCRQHQSSERMEADGLEIRNSLVNDFGHIFLTCFTRRATLTEPVDTSYRRGGDQIREMVMNLHPALKESFVK
ncbi:hypothetical protein LXL04_014882 [Taraxacum kok-saghyz]